jgi:hypothetical protein
VYPGRQTHDTAPRRLTTARKYNTNIDFDGYKAYRDARGRPPPTPPTNGATAAGLLPVEPADASEPPAPYPTSFAHIVELITSGQPVPGIKEIPNTVLEGQGTESVKARRKKPWEKDEAEGTAQASAT